MLLVSASDLVLSVFAGHTFHPRPQYEVFMYDFNKEKKAKQ
jgi:hypothetical protein